MWYMKIDLGILCFCYGCMTALIILDIINIFRKSKYISMYLLCKIMFCFVEGIIPLAMHIKFYRDGTLYPWNISIDYSRSGINALTLACLLACVGYVFITLGYKNRHNFTFGKRKINTSVNNRVRLEYDSILRYSAIVILFISVFSLLMWTKAYGGIFQFIMQANAIRSGYTNINNSYGFFKHFASSIVIPSYAFFILNIFAEKKKITDIILWIISLIFSVEFLLASDGRMTAGFYFIAYVAIYMQSKSKMIEKKISHKTVISVICLFGIAMLLMLKMDDFTYFIRNGVWNTTKSTEDNSIISSFVYELSFVVKSEQVAIMNAYKIGLQLFNDIGYGLFAWLPSSLAPSSFPRLWTLNSELSGAKSGELPCGIIAQGYYDLRLVGIIALTFIYGKIIKRMDSLEIKTPYGMTLYAALFYSIIRLVSYGMIYDFVQGLFNIFILFIVYFFLRQMLIVKK